MLDSIKSMRHRFWGVRFFPPPHHPLLEGDAHDAVNSEQECACLTPKYPASWMSSYCSKTPYTLDTRLCGEAQTALQALPSLSDAWCGKPMLRMGMGINRAQLAHVLCKPC